MSARAGGSRPRIPRTVTAAALALAVCASPGTQPSSAAPRPSPDLTRVSQAALASSVVEAVRARRIGTSVSGRAISAYRVGDPHASVVAVVVGSMHGDEPAGVRVARAIIRAAPARRIDLWVVPTINPDGLAAHARQNSHGVDLNRNWRHRWIHETGRYNSGPRPFSEPETRAMRRFLNRVDPRFIVSLHQPLHGVDSDEVKDRGLMKRLARNLRLPRKPLRCSDIVCHGTMTGWFNAHHGGACITVEFGSSPAPAYLTGRAARGIVRSVLGRA